MNAQEPSSLYITSISIAEISFGLHAMPRGRNAVSPGTSVLTRMQGCSTVNRSDTAATVRLVGAQPEVNVELRECPAERFCSFEGAMR